MVPIKSRSQLVEWVDSCVLGDLRTLLLGVDSYGASARHIDRDGKPLGAANFLLLVGCFSAIDYFGFLFGAGRTDELRARAFINRFMKPIDARYSEVGLLLWKCFRQGSIHRSWPKRIVSDCADVVVLTGAGTEESDPHLGPAAEIPGPSLILNGRLLLHDLEQAFDPGFRDWILRDAPDTVLGRANPSDLRIRAGDTNGQAQFERVLEWSTKI